MTSKRDERNLLSIKGIDRELWKWLKARGALEGRAAAEIINELIARYRNHESSSGQWLPDPKEHRPYYAQLTVRGLDRELWEWLKERAKTENCMVGEIINRMIERYREEVRLKPVPRTATFPIDMNHITNIRGLDRELWKELRGHAAHQKRTVGEVLNELIEEYRREVVWP